VKRLVNSASRNNNKGGKPLYREALPPIMRCGMAEHVCLLGNIAVTFGTLGKPFDRRGLWKSEIRSLSFTLVLLSTKAETSYYLMVALNVCTLQIIEQTATLRDHLEQAAPRVIVLFMGFEVFGKLIDPFAEQSYLNLW
jgi:hypothetical protein